MTPATPALKPLPIGIQSFARLREDGYLYVDKTADIHRLVTSGTTFFLSRPRRFGKSLLLSTLEELFKGNEPLFRGLAIHDKWDWTQKYPVIRIDWSGFQYSSLEDLDRQLKIRFCKLAAQYEITLVAQTLDELIQELHAKTGQKVVVLIDEYDILMLDTIADIEKFKVVQTYLHRLYRTLKTENHHLHFIFLTGVSRFAGVSVFSGLNNLNDITLDSPYATICGYTQRELEDCFAGHIEATSKALNCDRKKILDDMRVWYNGYSWDGETSVYNPFSILLFFDKQRFSNFWFQTGTPTFLIKLAETDNDVLGLIDSEIIYDVEDANMDPQNPDWISLLFQTGYLTIKNIRRIVEEEEAEGQEYTLDFPNKEVRKSFLKSLFKVYFNKRSGISDGEIRTMKDDLRKGDITAFETHLRSLLAKIPYLLTSKETESHYHVIMIVWLHMLGFKSNNEVMTNKGRIDAVLELEGQVIIIEIKLNHAATEADKEKLLDSAFAQIKEKGYADAYMGKPGKVSQLALAFFHKDVACRLEVLKTE